MHLFTGVLASALALGGQQGAPRTEPATTVKLRYDDAGRTIRVARGQPVRIALPAYYGSGFRWVTRPGEAFQLTAPIRIETDPATSRLDATIVRLVFTRAGPTTVELACVPGGSGGGAASDVLKYRFVVN